MTSALARSNRAGAPHGPANFDRLAPLYRWMEWLSFGPLLSRCRRAFLDRMGDRRRALILGDGDGRFTSALLRSNRVIEVDAVDASEAMLQALRRRAGSDGLRLHTISADLRAWKPSEGARYDMVASHFFLDCLTTDEVLQLARQVRLSVQPGALWVVSEFAIPERGLSRLISRMVVSALYRAFGLLTGLAVRTLPNHHAALQKAGFRQIETRTFLHGLLRSELWC